MSDLNNLKQGEQKYLVLTVRDASGQLVDLSSVDDLYLGVKKKKSDTTLHFYKEFASFTTTNAARGEISVLLTTSDTAEAGKFLGELKITFSDDTVEKTADFHLYIEQSIT